MDTNAQLALLQKFKRQYRLSRKDNKREVYLKNLDTFLADNTNDPYFLRLAELLKKDALKSEGR